MNQVLIFLDALNVNMFGGNTNIVYIKKNSINKSTFQYNLWFFILITVIIYGILLKFSHNKWSSKLSLKIQIGRLASGATRRVMNNSKYN